MKQRNTAQTDCNPGCNSPLDLLFCIKFSLLTYEMFAALLMLSSLLIFVKLCSQLSNCFVLRLPPS